MADFTKSASIVKSPGAQNVKQAIEINESNLDDLITAYNANVTKNDAVDVSAKSWVIDEDDLSSDSDAKVPLQGNVKAYVDTAIAATTKAYLKYSEVQAANTDGGAFTSGAWQTRVINTEDSDTDSIGSLSSNQITLPAGSYYIKGVAPAYKVNSHKLRLYDITNTATLLLGITSYANDGNNVANNALISGLITLAGATVIELQHRSSSSQGTNGFGPAANLGVDEVYTVLEIWER